MIELLLPGWLAGVLLAMCRRSAGLIRGLAPDVLFW